VSADTGSHGNDRGPNRDPDDGGPDRHADNGSFELDDAAAAATAGCADIDADHQAAGGEHPYSYV
jgi:hypothetical protein